MMITENTLNLLTQSDKDKVLFYLENKFSDVDFDYNLKKLTEGQYSLKLLKKLIDMVGSLEINNCLTANIKNKTDVIILYLVADYFEDKESAFQDTFYR